MDKLNGTLKELVRHYSAAEIIIALGNAIAKNDSFFDNFRQEAIDKAAGAMASFLKEFEHHGLPTYEKSPFSGEWHYSPIATGIPTQRYFEAKEALEFLRPFTTRNAGLLE